MICSDRELGLGEDHTGIRVLPADVGLGTDVRDLLADEVLDVAVSPDRGYCLSMRGMAREVATGVRAGVRGSRGAAAAGRRRRRRARFASKIPPVATGTSCAGSTGLDAAATTPLEIQRRLTMAGMRPISLAVDVTNYVMLGLGQPLHAFDAAKLRGTVSVRRARAGERLLTLDGTDRATASRRPRHRRRERAGRHRRRDGRRGHRDRPADGGHPARVRALRPHLGGAQRPPARPGVRGVPALRASRRPRARAARRRGRGATDGGPRRRRRSARGHRRGPAPAPGHDPHAGRTRRAASPAGPTRRRWCAGGWPTWAARSPARTRCWR